MSLKDLNDYYVRTPFLVIPYSSSNIAIPKELIMDFSKGDLYVKSLDGTKDIRICEYELNSILTSAVDYIKSGVSIDGDSLEKLKILIDSIDAWKLLQSNMIGDNVDSISKVISLLSDMEDIIDIKSELDKLKDSEGDKVSVSNNFTDDLLNKLKKIQTGANLYIHPPTKQCDFQSKLLSINGKVGDVVITKEDLYMDAVEPGANNYIHPSTKQCTGGVNSVFGKIGNVLVDKQYLDLGFLQNLSIAELVDIQNKIDTKYITTTLGNKYIQDIIAGFIDTSNPPSKYTITYNVQPSDIEVKTLIKGTWKPGLIQGGLFSGPYLYKAVRPNSLTKETGQVMINSANTIKDIDLRPRYTLTFITTPTEAEIKVLIETGTVTGKTHSLPDGVYSYTVSAELYYSKSGTVNINGTNVNHTVTLLRSHYNVSFTTNVDDVTIEMYIDNIWVTKSKIDNTLKIGTYKYRVFTYGYNSIDGTCTIINSDITVNVILTPKDHLLTINTIPSSAKVYVEYSDSSIVMGKTHNLINGTYNYKATNEFYHDTTGTFTVSDGDTVKEIILTKSHYKVTFNTTPPESKLYLYIDTVLTEINKLGTMLKTGSHNYVCKCDGYTEKSGTLTVGTVDSNVDVTLSKSHYTVKYITTPSDTIVEMYIDGVWTVVNKSGVLLKKGIYKYRSNANKKVQSEGNVDLQNSDKTVEIIMSDSPTYTLTVDCSSNKPRHLTYEDVLYKFYYTINNNAEIYAGESSYFVLKENIISGLYPNDVVKVRVTSYGHFEGTKTFTIIDRNIYDGIELKILYENDNKITVTSDVKMTNLRIVQIRSGIGDTALYSATNVNTFTQGYIDVARYYALAETVDGDTYIEYFTVSPNEHKVVNLTKQNNKAISVRFDIKSYNPSENLDIYRYAIDVGPFIYIDYSYSIVTLIGNKSYMVGVTRYGVKHKLLTPQYIPLSGNKVDIYMYKEDYGW